MALTQITTGGVDDNINIDSNTLKVDGTNNRVGIGTAAPDYALHAVGTIAARDSGTNTDIRLIPGNQQGSYSINANTAQHIFVSGANERMRIDSSGRLFLGTTTGRLVNNHNMSFQQFGTDSASSRMAIFRSSNDDGGSGLHLCKSRGTAGDVVVNDGDQVGILAFNVYDGTDFRHQCASIEANIDTTPGVDDVPGRLVFNTTANGGNAPSERMRIDSSGRLLVGTSSEVSDSEHAKVHIASTGGGALALGRNDSSVTSGNGIGLIRFYGNDGGSYQECARIEVSADGPHANNDKPTRMEFHTTADGASSPTERMRIDSSGKINIGTTSATQKVSVGTSASETIGYSIDWTGSGAGQVASFTANTSTGEVRIGATNSAGTYFPTFYSNNTERMRITSGGLLKASDSASYINSTGGSHEFNQSANADSLQVRATNSSFSSSVTGLFAVRAATSSYWFIKGVSSSGSASADIEFYIRGDGNAFADGSWSGGGADYAEYFEWSDGNTEAEDRRGISVVLDGDKIRKAVDGEEPIGVISGNPSVVGDADMDRWKGKHLRDDYGSYVLDEDGYRQLNPDFDSSVEYVQREDRPEWDTVGLMGKLRIRKGQVTGTRWIKMRDVSDTVEEWLVR